MGTFRHRIEVGDFAGNRFESLEALVDTGATSTAIPSDTLGRLGVSPEEQRLFVFANGQRVTYGVAWVKIRLDSREQPSPVIFGDEGSNALLGAVTLEKLGLGVDPVNRQLVTVPGYLVGVMLEPEP